MRMRLRVAGLGSQLRGRHNGELRRFFFKRMQFHVVDQHRGRDYAALRYIVRAPDQRKRRLVVQEFEHIVIVARAGAGVQSVSGWPPACAELPSSRRTSSNEADDGKSILRTIAPYGLLRCLHISISFFLRSATGTVSVARTKRLLMAAPFAPKLPGKRALPLEPANPGAGCRVSRKVFSTPFSTSDSGRGATPSRSTS